MTGRFDEQADPKVQLEQAIIEAQDQHRRLSEQAANVIANQKQTELRLNRSIERVEQVSTATPARRCSWPTTPTRPATPPRPASTTRRPRRSPTGSSASRRDVDDLKALGLQSAQAADQAKAAVQQNATALQQKLGERQKLLSASSTRPRCRSR